MIKEKAVRRTLAAEEEGYREEPSRGESTLDEDKDEVRARGRDGRNRSKARVYAAEGGRETRRDEEKEEKD